MYCPTSDIILLHHIEHLLLLSHVNHSLKCTPVYQIYLLCSGTDFHVTLNIFFLVKEAVVEKNKEQPTVEKSSTQEQPIIQRIEPGK